MNKTRLRFKVGSDLGSSYIHCKTERINSLNHQDCVQITEENESKLKTENPSSTLSMLVYLSKFNYISLITNMNLLSVYISPKTTRTPYIKAPRMLVIHATTPQLDKLIL